MTKYTELLKLTEQLQGENIPFTFESYFDGFHLCYPSRVAIVCSVIEHQYSYGHDEDLLEISGLLTREEMDSDDVVGYLTAEDVFGRIKKHWEEYKDLMKEMEIV